MGPLLESLQQPFWSLHSRVNSCKPLLFGHFSVFARAGRHWPPDSGAHCTYRVAGARSAL